MIVARMSRSACRSRASAGQSRLLRLHLFEQPLALLFGLDAFGHVLGNAEHLDQRAVVVEEAAGGFFDDDRWPVGANDAVGRAVAVARGRQAQHPRDVPRAILRMDALEVGGACVAGAHRAFRQPQDAWPTRANG